MSVMTLPKEAEEAMKRRRIEERMAERKAANSPVPKTNPSPSAEPSNPKRSRRPKHKLKLGKNPERSQVSGFNFNPDEVYQEYLREQRMEDAAQGRERSARSPGGGERRSP